MKSKAEKKELQEQAMKFLKKVMKPGKTVYTIVRSVSSSGMSRKITCLIANKGELLNIDWYVANALDYRRDKNNGAVIIGGCGMDMGFAIVYSLGRKLYPNGFKLAKGQYGRNGDKSGFDKDGGYSLNQIWI